MKCKHCGTEIADKAIVCFRCGAATTDPVRKAVPVRPRRSLLPSTLAAVVLLLAALYMGQASRTAADPAQWQTIAGVLAAAGILLLVMRIRRR
jgi:MYXO-CTERM domain-containing protein